MSKAISINFETNTEDTANHMYKSIIIKTLVVVIVLFIAYLLYNFVTTNESSVKLNNFKADEIEKINAKKIDSLPITENITQQNYLDNNLNSPDSLKSSNDSNLQKKSNGNKVLPIPADKNNSKNNSITDLELDEDEVNNINLFKKTSPSVVYITSVSHQLSPFSFNIMKIKQGSGSGFIWDKKGHIITNFHVIANKAKQYSVTLHDHTSWDAKIVDYSVTKDIAVLKIDAPVHKLKPIHLGVSSNLQVGQKVFAIGNPFGLDYTLTKGIVSALGREIESLLGRPINGVIQTDAAINPGNSGGPLLDSKGRLIGINTAIYSPSGASAGIGFAVPVDIAKIIVPRLLGNSAAVGIGIGLEDDAVSYKLGIKKGVIVSKILDGSSADKLGLEPPMRDRYRNIIFDVIVNVDGHEIKDSLDLFSVLTDRKVGEIVKIKIKRIIRYADGQFKEKENFHIKIPLININ